MKKITLSLAGLLISCLGFAQVGIVQNFPTTTLPTGWTSPAGFLSTTQACASASWRVNIYDFLTESSLTTPTQVSNGSDLTISFDYKIVNWSAPTVATNPYNGTITTEISLDGGDSWGVSAGVINNSNHVVANTCATVTYVVPGAEVPAGSNVRIRWRCNFGTSGDYYVYIDNISATQPSTTPPACTTLSSPADGAQNVTSPVLTWADQGGLPTGYRLTIGTTPTGTQILNNVDVGNVTTYNLGSLLSGTTYYVTIKPYNANGEATGCVSTSFSTCSAGTVPFLEVFDVANPTCWTRGTGGTPATGPANFVATNTWVADGFANNGTTGAIKNNIYQAIRNDWFISPAIAIPTNGYELRFDAAATQFAATTAPTTPWELDDFIQVLVQVEGTTAWQEVYIFNSNNQPSASGTPYIIPLSAYSGQTIKVAFRAFEGTQDGVADIDFSIDNFEISPVPSTAPNCTSVTTPTDGAQNVVSSLITWAGATGSPTGYRLTVGTTPTGTQILNNFDVGNTTTYNIGALLSGTTYYVTVIPYNASGNATGCLTSTFSTCGALSVPLLEPFDVASPECWTRGNGGDPATGPTSQVTTNTWVADGYANVGTTGSLRINIDGASKNAWVISPAISIPTNGYELRFNAAATQAFGTGTPTTPWEADDFVQVLVQVEGTTTWQQLLLFNNTNVPPAAGIAYNASLAAYSGQNIRIAFRGFEGTANGAASIDFFVDNFEVTETQNIAPECTSLTIPADGAQNVQSSLITWGGATGFPTGYRLTIGTTPTGSQILNNVDVGNVTSYNLGFLLSGTTYYVTVTPYNATGAATGCTTSSFSTCNSLTAPLLEDFTAATPECWSRGTGGNTTTGPANFAAFNSWYNDGFANVGTTGAPTINIWQATRNDWFISPAISIPATGYELKFDAAANQYGSTTQIDKKNYTIPSITPLESSIPLIQFNNNLFFIDKKNIYIIHKKGKMIFNAVDSAFKKFLFQAGKYTSVKNLFFIDNQNAYYFILQNSLYKLNYENNRITSTFLFDMPEQNIIRIHYNQKYGFYVLVSLKGHVLIVKPTPFNHIFFDDYTKDINYNVKKINDDEIYSNCGWSFNFKNHKLIEYKLKSTNNSFILPLNNSYYIQHFGSFINILNSSDKLFKTNKLIDFVSYTASCHHKDRVWICKTDLLNSVNYIENESLKRDDFATNYFKNESITGIYSFNNDLFFTGTKGIYIYSPEQKKISSVQGLGNVYVRNLIRIDNEKFWVCTYGNGLYLLKKLKPYHVHVSKPDYFVSSHSVEEDSLGRIWVSSNEGLFMAYKSRVITTTLQGKTNEFFRFTVDDGLLTNEFNGGSTSPSVNMNKKIIGFPGMNGFVWFYPGQIRANPFDKEIIVTAVRSEDKLISPKNDSYYISKNADQIILNFDYAYHENQVNLAVSYKLDGKEVWNKAENKQIQFSRPGSGGKHLIIRIHTKGVSSKADVYKKITFYFEPKFYELPWFWVGIFLLLLLILFVSFKIGLKINKKKALFFQKKVLEKTQELNEKNLQLEKSRNKLLDSLTEKEILLKEIHHRVKNNLQLVISILSIQARKGNFDSIDEFIQKAQNRITSMSIIHEILYKSDSLSSVDFASYLEILTNTVKDSYHSEESNINIQYDIEPHVNFHLSTSISMGLIVNELLTNAFKHAFKTIKDSPTIWIRLRQIAPAKYMLELKDNGIGYSIQQFRNKSFGLQLIQILVSQLQGHFEVVRDADTTSRVIFHDLE
ncbi:hypothetical protein CHU92_14055 [Flavobacterium cyanobacteriorum]|uniref:histidine kinase n=1 Tax=Flavobacterium cyanobacteriorum TaxID=2022802 RepID=A0A255YSK9_9FLAO|nr:histidine kinase dimerization/phosphoacceptor domain -containing protein [Flavobacterium cyanobacteriorum]OYQ32207.1 hypothetical protein CHU92_14055 [Flavobacterium cyanobacteriorum]